jgi:type II restriction/modification system DNA methylase subunit YeeA
MNTNHLKRFAQAARIKLLNQIGAKLEKVMTTDSAELREKASQIKQLQEAINQSSKAQVIDTVAYTWFNRLVALRFMDVNGYEPIGIKVVSPAANATLPELLQEAKAGNIPKELPVNHQRIFDLLDGKIPATNAQNEAYRELLVGACNQLHSIFPFLFEKIKDYSELLLPDDLLSEFSIIEDIKNGMPPEDCEEVEILGWLYQFYISALNEKLISSKKIYTKSELAPASQLFTPKWIVQYMVDNTLGQLWSEIRPDSKVIDTLDFYIKPAYKDSLEKRKPKSIENVKFFEPCVGSGHILSYAFDVFYKMYEEEGYNPSEIPKLIISKNLFGVDIDERAAQIASFVLLMKGRKKQKRFLRAIEKEKLQPNITHFRDFEFDNKFKNATALGSLIQIEPEEVINFNVEENSLFAERQQDLYKLYQLLGQRYDCVVTNPPYISSSRMEGSLKQFVEANYPETKSDLFATFVLRCLELCNEEGLTGYMTPFVWMFISSYEKLRVEIIEKHFINNLIQLEYSGFDGATVPICTFTLRNKNINDAKGSYIRLSDFKGAPNQAPKTLEAIQNPNCGWFFTTNQNNFEKIPGSPLSFWTSSYAIKIFEQEPPLKKFASPSKGMMPGPKFIRFNWEISLNKLALNVRSHAESKSVSEKWYPYFKGGEYRKWYGNREYLVDFYNDGENLKKNNYGERNPSFYFLNQLNWTKISSAKFSMRDGEIGGLYDDAACQCPIKHENDRYYLLSYLNSKIATTLLSSLSNTLNFSPGEIAKIPIIYINTIHSNVSKLGKQCLDIAQADWDLREVSRDFLQNELLKHQASSIEESYDLYQQYWRNKFFQLHKNEEELNRQFIEIYGLQDELTPDVPLKDITILKEEATIVNDQLVFNAKEVMQQFVSYAVGCMFGRYSLDKSGLILANQGEILEDYLNAIANYEERNGKQSPAFLPDKDNILPILDNEWFEDDIVGRFYEFLKASFGEENFNKNLAFIEECLGKDIRKYFLKDFYGDHIKRYKKRPIYWMFSSPSGAFNALIYMHRYTPNTLNQILNGYLKQYREKLQTELDRQAHLKNVGTPREQTLAQKEEDRIHKVLLELQEYERELYKLATERIAIDLDDGVLVNYNKFGNVIKPVAGLNDKKTKDKVKGFDWIDVTQIR